jgi:hypothetical protein
MEREQAAEWLSSAAVARRHARDASHRAWFPLVVLGLITLAATPFYTVTGPSEGIGFVDIWGDYIGGFLASNPQRLSMYWLVATIGGYVATVAYFRWQGARSGVRTPVWPFVATGLALLALLVLSSPHWLAVLHIPQTWSPCCPADLYLRGLLPVLTIAIGLLVLAAIERTWAFAVFAVGFLGIALVVNLYDIGNLTARIGLGPHGVQANVVFAGVVLLAGGIAFAVLGRRRA